MKAIVQSGVKMIIWNLDKIGCKRCTLSDGSLCCVLFNKRLIERLSKTSQSENEIKN